MENKKSVLTEAVSVTDPTVTPVSSSPHDKASATAVADGAMSPTVVRASPVVPDNAAPRVTPAQFPQRIARKLRRVLCRRGNAFFVLNEGGNSYALRIGSRKADALIAEVAANDGLTLRKRDLSDLNEQLRARCRKGRDHRRRLESSGTDSRWHRD